MFCSAYMHSVVGLQKHCLTNGIDFELAGTQQVTNIDRARNVLAAVFLWKTTATHMLLIDDDMGFDVQELVKMFQWRDKDVVAVMCPKKKFDWQRVKQIVLANPDIDAARLPGLATEYSNMFVFPEEASVITFSDKPISVEAIGTGLMLISRQCLLRLVEKANLPVIEQHAHTGGNLYEFFKTQIVDGRHQGEDFYFCELVRRHGGEILGCPWIPVTHTGQYSYEGDLMGLARYFQKG